MVYSLDKLVPGTFFFYWGKSYELIDIIRHSALCRRCDDDVVICFSKYATVRV